MKRAILLLLVASLALSCSSEEATIVEAQVAIRNVFGGLMPTQTLKPDAGTLYFNVEFENVSEPLRLQARWHAVEVAVSEPQVLTTTDFTLQPPNLKASFNFGIEGPWPIGKYKVELYVNDVLERTVEFIVSPL